ncbi:MAG: Hsp70 family protein [Treponema sp.]|jgi:hypothetical protein|nr:Hsp70 family protein [Treponema sp.]
MAAIGIKQANGDFYSILEENQAARKRLVLTTAHDNQKSVQIDLFKSPSKTMADAMYIGTIVVENLSPKSRGEPSIELILSSTADGEVSAGAADLGNPSNEHHLSIHLKSFEEDQNEYPDFDMDGEDDEQALSAGRAKKRKFPWPAVIIAGLVLIALGLGAWFFLLRKGTGAPAEEESAPPPVSAAAGAYTGGWLSPLPVLSCPRPV